MWVEDQTDIVVGHWNLLEWVVHVIKDYLGQSTYVSFNLLNRDDSVCTPLLSVASDLIHRFSNFGERGCGLYAGG